jgi:hypothetical protein
LSQSEIFSLALAIFGNLIGQSLLQIVFAAFIGFFFYRDGEALIQTLRKGMMKLLGFSVGVDPLATIHNIVTGVYGIFGAASAQAIAATIVFFHCRNTRCFLTWCRQFCFIRHSHGPCSVMRWR